MSILARLRAALDHALHREDMTGDGACPIYLTRWRLASGRDWTAYLHWFRADDWAIDHHDHPKPFWSIGLRGRYIEHTPDGSRVWRAPWVRRFPAEHRHRITLVPGETAWTIAIAGKAERAWGFWLDGEWIFWRWYVDRHAVERKAC